MLDIVGIKLWGYMAVCYATVLSQIVLIALHYIVAQRMGVQKILTLKTLILVLAAAVGLIPISLLLYQSNMVRYIFAAVLFVAAVVLLIIKREQLMIIVRKIRKEKKA